MYVLDEGGFLGLVLAMPRGSAADRGDHPTATVDIPGEVLNAFKRVALPQSTINVQPPGGETLVNLPTILSTSAERHQIPVRLERVNIDVLLEVWPSRFVWHHGDDTSQETTSPGQGVDRGSRPERPDHPHLRQDVRGARPQRRHHLVRPVQGRGPAELATGRRHRDHRRHPRHRRRPRGQAAARPLTGGLTDRRGDGGPRDPPGGPRGPPCPTRPGSELRDRVA